MKGEEKGLAMALAGAAAAFVVALVASKVVLGILAGDAILDSYRGGAAWLEMVGAGEHPSFPFGVTLFVVIPVLYAASSRGVAVQLTAGFAASWAIAMLPGGDQHLSAALLGAGLTIVSCFTSHRRYLAAAITGTVVALVLADADKMSSLVPAVVVGLLVLGPTIAIGAESVGRARVAADRASELPPLPQSSGIRPEATAGAPVEPG